MRQFLYVLKFKLGMIPEWDWDNIRRIEDWIQLRHRNETHTDAGYEQILINTELKSKVPIHMSKLHNDWYLREDYLSKKKEFQEM